MEGATHMTVLTGDFRLYEPVMCDGLRGTVVDAYPERDSYTVELFDDDGETVDVVVRNGAQLERRTVRPRV
jgi:hypothetical protein